MIEESNGEQGQSRSVILPTTEVLVVDEDRVDLHYYSVVLQMLGCQV
jgi:hypothetical protein